MEYFIFARRDYGLPLEWIGRLQEDELGAGAGEQAESVKRQALERFGDAEWIEMVAVPERAMVRVIPLE